MPAKLLSVLFILLSVCVVSAQDENAYSSENAEKSGLFGLDPSRLTIQNSLSFGAATGGGNSDLRSQSLYSTMMRYQFTAPVTMYLNFSLPIHSSFSTMQNLTGANLQSMDYFRSIPFEMSLSWQPTKNMNFQLSVIRPGAGYFNSYGYGYDSFYRPWRYSTPSSESSNK